MDIGIFGESQFYQGFAFLLTENHANSRMLIRRLHIAVKIVDIHLHLAKVLMGEPTDFQINQHIATQQAVVENEVNEEMVVVKGEALLTGLKQKAFAKLQQKMFELVDDGSFKIGFRV